MGGSCLTLRHVGGLVIAFSEPLEVLVLEPGHPPLVLLIVGFFDPFGERLFVALLSGEAVVQLPLLFFGVVERTGGLLDGVHRHY